MTATIEDPDLVEAAVPPPRRRRRSFRRALIAVRRFVALHVFSSLTRRIIVLNLAALLLLLSGILYLNQFRAGLIDARVESLLTQGEIIAGAIAAQATADTDTIVIDPDAVLDLDARPSVATPDQAFNSFEFAINPERVAPVLRRLISPTRTRARIYDRDGSLIVDSLHLYSRGEILRFDLPPPADQGKSWFEDVWAKINYWLQRSDLPVYRELGGANGKGYPEVITALDGTPNSIVRVTDAGALIVSVAVPIQRYRSVYGALLLSTQGGDIDSIVHAERLAMVRVFVVAAVVTVLLSMLMAGTIATPLRKLADAADRVRRGGLHAKPRIPDYSHRRDEIGHLSQAVGDMTQALYDRIAAIESFAADVAHELKNPLTSLKSAVETLPLARNDEAKARLTGIILHDVKRLNRLITDISDASRLDAELARQDAAPVDLRQLLTAVVGIARETTPAGGAKIELHILPGDPEQYFVFGHDSRLGQVFNNLIDNARSFCRQDGKVRVTLKPLHERVEVTVEDDGPGIRPDQFERIFERFYTDRPDEASFGQNSGLGLSISKQIVEAHRGRIHAENRTRPAKEPGAPPMVLGARFIVRLPAA